RGCPPCACSLRYAYRPAAVFLETPRSIIFCFSGEGGGAGFGCAPAAPQKRRAPRIAAPVAQTTFLSLTIESFSISSDSNPPQEQNDRRMESIGPEAGAVPVRHAVFPSMVFTR